jgi:hypothetical protein
MTPPDLAALRTRLDALLGERDRQFPRRDPANTLAVREAIASWTAAMRQVPAPPWKPDPPREADALGFAEAAVFVGGAMKSGTTLLVGLLDGHPELTVLPGDSHMLALLARERPEAGNAEAAMHWMAVLVNPYGQRPFWFLGDAPEPYRDFLHALAHWRQVLPADSRREFLSAVLALHCVNPRRARQPRAWVEKTPGNEARVAALLALFPRARFLHVVREPRANLASIKQLVRYRGWRWRAPMAIWRLRRSLAAAHANRRRLAPDRYHVVRYEDLVTDPRGVMAGVAAFLGVGWDDGLLTATSNGEPLTSNSMYEDRRVSGAIMGVVDERWRQELSVPEQALAALLLRSAGRGHGYASW